MNGSFHKMKGSAHKEMSVVLKEAHRLSWRIARWNKHYQLVHLDFPADRPLTVPGNPKNPTATRKQMMKKLYQYLNETTI